MTINFPQGLWTSPLSRAQNKDFKMDGHDGQPILDSVSHLHQLLGYATPCQWDNTQLAIYATPYQWDNTHLVTNSSLHCFVEGQYNKATNYMYFNYLPQVVTAHLHLELRSMATVVSCWRIQLAARTGTNQYLIWMLCQHKERQHFSKQ